MLTPNMIRLANIMETYCPDNDCRIYLNLYRLYKEYKIDLERPIQLGMNSRRAIEKEMHRTESDLCDMYFGNYAVRTFRREVKCSADCDYCKYRGTVPGTDERIDREPAYYCRLYSKGE